MPAPGTQDTRNANPTPVMNGLGLPPGINPLMIPLQVDMTVAQSVLVDLTQQQQGGQIGPIQTIYINNTSNGQPVTIIAPILNQSYTIPAGDSAILPFFLPNQAPKFTVNSTGGVIIPIAVLNIPLPAQVWGTSFGGAGLTPSGGKVGLNTYDIGLNPLVANIGEGPGLAVYDLALNPLITNQGAGLGLDVNVLSGGGGGKQAVPILTGEINSGALFITSAAPTVGTTTWNVTSVDLEVSNDVVLAAGGIAQVRLYYVAVNNMLGIWRFSLPTAAAASPFPSLILANHDYADPLFAAGSAGFALRVDANNGAVLTGGSIFVNVWGFAQ